MALLNKSPIPEDCGAGGGVKRTDGVGPPPGTPVVPGNLGPPGGNAGLGLVRPPLDVGTIDPFPGGNSNCLTACLIIFCCLGGNFFCSSPTS